MDSKPNYVIRFTDEERAAMKARADARKAEEDARRAKLEEERKARMASVAKTASACVALLLLAAGCQQVPSRSQTLTVRDCTINVYGGSDTNHVASVEIGTQAMAIENNGTETMTPTQTTDVKPDVDVSVGAAKGGGILETAAAAGVQRLLAPSASATGVGSTATVNSSSCEGGDCTYGGCTDGNCYAQ